VGVAPQTNTMSKSPTIERARSLRRDMTPPERQLWGYLRTLRPEGYHFRRQAPFQAYVLDFVCYRLRLVIEVDGAQHGIAARRERDAQRDAVLAGEGFRTIRVNAADVLNNLEGVCMMLRTELAAPHNLAAPHPCPPHEGEGEV
jgi:very-short-patch-repair endonuclease